MESTRPLLLALLLALPAAATIDGVTVVQPEIRFFNSWIDSASFQAFERAELGSFSGEDPFPDMAVLVRDTSGNLEAHHSSNVQYFNTVQVLEDSGVKDLAVLPDVSGTRDGVLVLRTGGVDLHEAPSGSVSMSQSSVAANGAPWSSVDRIWVVPEEGGGHWILGHYLDGSGNPRIVRKDWANPGTTPDEFDLTTHASLGTLQEILAIDWDAQTPLENELVLWYVDGATGVGTAKVVRWDPSATTLQPVQVASYTASPGSGVAEVCAGISRGPGGGGATDRDLLVLYDHDGSDYRLRALNSGASSSRAMPSTECAQLTTVDYDGDGREEVVLADASDRCLYLASRQSGASPFHFSTVRGYQMNLVGSSASSSVIAEQPATLLVGGDLDGDGDGDMVAFQDMNHGVQLFHAREVNGWRMARVHSYESTLQNTTGLVSLDVAGQMPHGSLPQPPTGESLWVLFEAWYQGSLTSGLTLTRVARSLEPEPSGTSVVSSSLSWTGTFDSEAILHVFGTPIWRDDATGDITRYFPTHLEMFAPDDVVEGTLETEVYSQRWGVPSGAEADTSTGHDNGDGNICGTRTTNPPPGPPPVGLGKRSASGT